MSRKVTLVAVVLLIAMSVFGMAKQPGLWALYDAQIKTATFVDLTHAFDGTTPVWEGFGQAKFEPAKDAEGNLWTCETTDNFFRATIYTHVGQYGTHVDPPSHFCDCDITCDEIPCDEMILPLCVIDITDKLVDEPSHQCSVDDILEWEKEYGNIPEGAFVALRSDMYKDWQLDKDIRNFDNFKRYPFPAWGMEAIQFLYDERGITANGHEAMDTDTLGCSVEKWLLAEGHWQIEVLRNLDLVPEAGALIVVSWPKPFKGDGFPARAFAICP
ncbi:cyclase family protein [candidate division WOR-3 bacterium]|nr:cyclase family protein [candidate division WOR-3 bacterium]